MEASRAAISRRYATASQRKLDFGTGRTGEPRRAAAEASEIWAAKTNSKARRLRSLIASFTEPPDTDPYVRWCGRGGVARLPPIPILRLRMSPLLPEATISRLDALTFDKCRRLRVGCVLEMQRPLTFAKRGGRMAGNA